MATKRHHYLHPITGPVSDMHMAVGLPTWTDRVHTEFISLSEPFCTHHCRHGTMTDQTRH